MELVKPEFGLIFWMSISFLIVVFLMRKFAWGPILSSLKERETSISDALNAAKKAKEEVANMTAENERILQEARNERDVLLREARETKDQIINESRAKAQVEGDRLITLAREAITNEKMAAITDLKNQVAYLSIEIAEKMIRQKLSNDEQQKALVQEMLKDVKMN
ncbi:MAG: F0F1 ATP synthase subunit B [Bacteroidia bacterium]|jgi:F-type H+-transporting ATPase subunit b|nr:F0F1 ATP synthase subunit B [Bacteroidota bacterium]MBK9639046.1 F0F1 ATP synthase subunit B [Bacteroidota bacterium]MBP6512868.1 F0F1 ATP synthase subunit B [Bacteroidia bacterium]MBP7245786.1 F0F1 ATP synthase subunit B [Bacteroidia bacterium]